MPILSLHPKLVGEGADDAGGGYYDSITDMCDELNAGDVLRLFIKAPNWANGVGSNVDRYIFNPRATSSYELKLFQFLGIFMGIAIRTMKPINL